MFENEKKIFENSIKMYDETLKTMKERGAKPESISLVLEMRRQIEEQLKYLESGKTDILFTKYYGPFDLSRNVYTSNRFVFNLKESEVAPHFVQRVYFTNNGPEHNFLNVTFINSEGFFAPEYFEKKKNFDNAQLFIIGAIGDNKAVIEFDDIEVKSVTTDEFDYEKNDTLKTYVTFSFKSLTHKTL